MLPPEGEQPTSARRPVVLVALGILVADLVTKQIMLALVFDPPRRIEVTPFLNFVPVWNPGVSFGILADAGGAVPLLLTALAIGVAAWLFWKTPHFRRFERLGAGLIAGGAIGNAIDRIRFGKVVDFIDVYVQTWHWPVFNIADAAITLGAGCWIASLFLERENGPT